MADLDLRVAAFVEHVLRPLSKDWKQILDQLKALNIGIDARTLKTVAMGLALWHLCGEVIRALCYVTVVWIVCQTVKAIL